MKTLVIGAGGKIGSALVGALREAGHEVQGTTRKELNLLDVPETLAFQPDVIYICAASTRFIDCETDPQAYKVNVDGPIEVAKRFGYAKIVYLSSESVDKALHTNYGMHKALAEIGLRAVCDPRIARLGRVDPHTMSGVCNFLVGLADSKPGVYHWKGA
jgi:dTDP-4-dehydrorhamnose reductase